MDGRGQILVSPDTQLSRLRNGSNSRRALLILTCSAIPRRRLRPPTTKSPVVTTYIPPGSADAYVAPVMIPPRARKPNPASNGPFMGATLLEDVECQAELWSLGSVRTVENCGGLFSGCWKIGPAMLDGHLVEVNQRSKVGLVNIDCRGAADIEAHAVDSTGRGRRQFNRRADNRLAGDAGRGHTATLHPEVQTGSGRGKQKAVTRTDQIREEIRAANAHARVPIPPAPPDSSNAVPRVPRWFVALLPILLAGFFIAAIRGDQPTTVVVEGGAVTPTPGLAAELFVEEGTYSIVDPTVGDQLEVCSWDYCLVHDRIGDARIEQFTYVISLDEARAIARSVTDSLDLPSVSIETRDLAGELAGFYDPATASITLDEPIVAWTVIHELAHHVVASSHEPNALSHGDLFLGTLNALVGK